MFYYPAISEEGLAEVCQKLATAFNLSPFQIVRQSEHLETAESTRGMFGVMVTRYIGRVTIEQVRDIGRPDHSPLAWRARKGFQYNYRIGIARGGVSTWTHKRSIAHKLRSAFTEIQLGGEPLPPNKSPEPTAVGAAVAIHAASRRRLSFGR
jgi:hypothetical protein